MRGFGGSIFYQKNNIMKTIRITGEKHKINEFIKMNKGIMRAKKLTLELPNKELELNIPNKIEKPKELKKTKRTKK